MSTQKRIPYGKHGRASITTINQVNEYNMPQIIETSEKGMSANYIQFVRFKELTYWDFNTYFRVQKNNYHYPTVKLEEVIRQRKGSITIDDGKIYKRPTVKLYGNGVFLRDEVLGKDIKVKRQQICKGNDLLVAEIDAKVGGFGIIPEYLEGAIVSSHYFLFEVDIMKLDLDYISIYIKTAEFQKQVQATGSTNYAAIRPHHFLSYTIPLPDIDTQKRIVSEYYSKIDEAKRLDNLAIEKEKEIETYLMNTLGITVTNTEKKQGLNFVRLKDITQWGLDFILNTSNSSSKYKTISINTVCKISSGGTPSRSNPKYFGGTIPWIKTGELNHSIIYDTEEKITELGLENSSCKLYEEGSLILAMYGATIGKTAKLGMKATTNQACAVLFAFKKELINPDFLWIFLQSQVENFKKLAYGGAQPNINAGIVGNYQIPCIPLSLQEEIICEINLMKSELNNLRKNTEALGKDAKENFEKELFS